MSGYPCPGCGGDTDYQAFSGGREWRCPKCATSGEYPQEGEGLPRATLLRTPEGVVALRAQMDQEMARRRRLSATTEGERGERDLQEPEGVGDRDRSRH